MATPLRCNHVPAHPRQPGVCLLKLQSFTKARTEQELVNQQIQIPQQGDADRTSCSDASDKQQPVNGHRNGLLGQNESDTAKGREEPR